MMNRNSSLNEVYNFVDALVENSNGVSLNMIKYMFWDNFNLSGMNRTEAYTFSNFIDSYIERCFNKKNIKKDLAVSI